MDKWIIFVIIYAMSVSIVENKKKKALKMNSIYEVLAVFSTIAFILSAIITRDAFVIDYNYLPMILLKSTIIVVAFILSLKALEKMQISLYSMIKISSVVFSVILSYVLLGEQLTVITLIGIIIVVIGLVLVNKENHTKGKKKNSLKWIALLLASCLLNSISAIIDKKILMSITSSQLQFWFLLFLTLYYWIILLTKREKIHYKKMVKNYWIPLASIALVIGDRCLFEANENPNSMAIVIAVLKQLSVISSIFLGKLMFNEKKIVKKLLYSILIIIGVVLMFIKV